MKTLNKIFSLAVAGMIGAGMVSCSEDNDWGTDSAFSRLFGVNGEKISVDAGDVTATVTFTSVPDAKYYIIEVSTDSLYDDVEMGGANALVYGVDKSVTGSPVTITGLAGDTKYFLRMKSMSDSISESHWAYLREGETVKTFKTDAEQIFSDPVASDRSENSLRVAWTAGTDVTNLVVTDGDGNEVQDITLDDAAKAAGEYTITGLTASTSYTIVIYNGEAKRGTLNLSTTAAMPEGDYKTELSADITRINGDVLNDIVEAAKAATGKETGFAITIGLQPDMTYDVASVETATNGTVSDAPLALPDGISFTFFGLSGGEAPIMKMLKTVDLAGTHSWVRFENIEFADGGSQYFINQSTSASIGEISFKQCKFTDFARSVIRTQGSSGIINIDNIIIDDCVLTNMSTGNGYAPLHLDASNAQNSLGKVEISNSTFDTTQHNFIQTSKVPITNGLYISNCTLYNNVASTRYLVDSKDQNTNIVIENTIIGKSYSDTARGIRTNGTMVFDNCLRTSDCVYASNDIKDLTADERSSADIFTDPNNHDFTLKISQRIGDPRWYAAE